MNDRSAGGGAGENGRQLLAGVATGSTLTLVLVFVTAFSIIFLESLLFQGLLFVANYIEAMMAIPIALLGISVGALFVYLFRRHLRPTLGVLSTLLALLALSFPATLWAIGHFSGHIYNHAYLLLVPFALGSVILSIFFVHAPSGRVYFADLVGAGAGASAAAFALELFGTEVSMLVGAVLVSVVGLVFAVVVPRRITPALLLFVALVAGTGWVAHEGKTTDRFNLIRWATIQKDGASAGRAYFSMQHEKFIGGSQYRRLMFSHVSAAGRTDAIGTFDTKDDRIRRVRVFQNGQGSDSFKFRDVHHYSLDPRVPWGFIEDPDSLIIGTSAEGVVSAVKGMGKGKVWGVEICSGKVLLMTEGPGVKHTFNAYKNLDDLEIIDARSYLNNHPDRKFDHITMMNAHLGGRMGRAAAPEYLQTVDALASYFDHLTDRGFLNIEETSTVGTISPDTNIKLTRTIIEALLRMGVRDPGAHLYVYRWSTYIQWFVKKKPFTEAELEWLDDWLAKQTVNRSARPFRVVTNIVWHPRKNIVGPIAEMIRSRGAFKRPGLNLDFTTDDRPFGFDILEERPMVTQAMVQMIGLALLIVLLPAVVLTFVTLRIRPLKATAMITYFGLIGLAYLAIEITLIQKFQMYVGTPVGSVIAVLGGMLAFSGLGSLASGWFTRSGWRIGAVFVAIAVTSFGLLIGFEQMADALGFESLAARMLLTVVAIAPAAFFMGMPFPIALTMAKEQSNPSAGALMFAINGAFSAMATPIACWLSMNHGFRATLAIGAGIYLALALVFRLVRR